MHSPHDRPGKVTKACVDARYEELREALKIAPAPTRRMRERAAQACAEGACKVATAEPVKWRAPWLVILAPVAVLVWLLLSSGCVPVEAVNQAATEAAICHGHASDETLPVEARQIGASEAAAWAAQYRSLTGEAVPGSETWGAQ